MPATVADHVLARLAQQHVDTLFGVPAATCYPLFDAAGAHGIRAVVTASDLEAGYAADGYARTRGLGAVAVAYGVGTLSMINAIAGACVERSPVVVVNGGPRAGQLHDLAQHGILFSHSTGRPDTDLRAYELVTARAVRAGTVAEVPAAVDGAITTALTEQRPVYLEIDSGLWTRPCPPPAGPLPVGRPPVGTEAALAARIVDLVRGAASPLLVVGSEIQRYGLADPVADLIARLGVQWSTALLARSTLAEEDSGWVGVLNPPRSAPAVAAAVRAADLIVLLGCVLANGYRSLVTDGPERIVSAYDGQVRITGGPGQAAEIGALVSALVAEAGTAPPRAPAGAAAPVLPVPGPPPAAGPLTHRQLFASVGAVLDESWIVVADTFLGVSSAANLPVRGRDGFLCGGVWASIGHSVAAAVGASYGSARRPLVICGDGGFRMTGQALSTMAGSGRNPVVVVVDNGLYAYEQYLIDPSFFGDPGARPRPYVVLDPWDLVQFAHALGIASARSVDTPAALDEALAAAARSDAPALIVARVDPHDLPAELG